MSLVNDSVEVKPEVTNQSPKVDELPPETLTLRLARESKHAAEQATAKILADLGYSSLEEAKSAREAALAAKEASKSELQKATEERNRLLAAAANAEQLKEETRLIAEDALSKLTPAQHQSVIAIAGDSPSLQLKTIRAMAPTWVTTVGASAESIPPTIPPAKGPTAPAGTPPSPAHVSPIDHTSVWKSLASNPFRQADYFSKHARFITV